MLVVTVKIERSDPTDTSSATIVTTKEGKTPHSVEVDPAGSENERKILLDADEKLTIEGKSETVLVWDKSQNMAIPVPRDPVKAEEMKIERQRIWDENIAAQNEAVEEAKRLAEERAATAARTNIGGPVSPETEAVMRDTTMQEASTMPPRPGSLSPQNL